MQTAIRWDWYVQAGLVTESCTDDTATITVTAAVAFQGQVVVEKVVIGGQVGASGGGASGSFTVGTDINLPKGTDHKKKITRIYTYKCVRCVCEDEKTLK